MPRVIEIKTGYKQGLANFSSRWGEATIAADDDETLELGEAIIQGQRDIKAALRHDAMMGKPIAPNTSRQVPVNQTRTPAPHPASPTGKAKAEAQAAAEKKAAQESPAKTEIIAPPSRKQPVVTKPPVKKPPTRKTSVKKKQTKIVKSDAPAPEVVEADVVEDDIEI